MKTRIPRPLTAVLIAGTALLLGAAATLAQSEETIVIGDSLRPAQLEVTPGTVVTWRNDDDARHRVRSREGPVEFDSGNLEPGEVYVFTFVVEGVYPYRDERNDEDPAYVGSVVVRAATGTSGPPPTSASVVLFDEAFHPPALEVAAGAKVEWSNQDGDDQHTVTSVEGLFDSGVMEGGETFAWTFESGGTFAYFCAFHPQMVGSVSVSGPGAEPVEEPAPPEPVAVAASEVSILDLAFQPERLEVAVGTTVAWSNDDPFPHTVTATDGTFDSGSMAGGETFARTFDTPGTYAYFCALHPSMQGSVTVADPAAAGSPAPVEPAEPPTDGLPALEVAAAISGNAFVPADLEVSAGATVTWTSEDAVPHTVTAVDGTFASGVLAEADAFTHTFETPGPYDYFCAIHPDMRGRVTVLSGRLPAGGG
jgi:plastocyanin